MVLDIWYVIYFLRMKFGVNENGFRCPMINLKKLWRWYSDGWLGKSYNEGIVT